MARSKNFVSSILLNKKTASIFGVIAVIAIGVIGVRAVSNNSSNDKQLGSTVRTQNNNSKVKGTQKIEVGQSIKIPTGKNEEDFITYTIVDAELKDQIVLQGQTASAVEGKQFLVLNIKLSNNLEKKVVLNTRDNIRLSVNGSSDRLAPNIHNDPVEVQPISDQITRLGFSVFKTDTDYKLYLGEISEEKIEIPLVFN